MYEIFSELKSKKKVVLPRTLHNFVDGFNVFTAVFTMKIIVSPLYTAESMFIYFNERTLDAASDPTQSFSKPEFIET